MLNDNQQMREAPTRSKAPKFGIGLTQWVDLRRIDGKANRTERASSVAVAPVFLFPVDTTW